jgi:hypothetical protein
VEPKFLKGGAKISKGEKIVFIFMKRRAKNPPLEKVEPKFLKVKKLYLFL